MAGKHNQSTGAVAAYFSYTFNFMLLANVTTIEENVDTRIEMADKTKVVSSLKFVKQNSEHIQLILFPVENEASFEKKMEIYV
jgi:hypothetical protein